MTVNRPMRGRRGYTLTVVVISLMLLFAVACFASRTTSSLLRVETNRVLQQTRDQGAMNAMAQALQLLQYGSPPQTTSPPTPYLYGVTINLPNTGGGCTPTDYTILYTYRPDLGPERWEVQVSQGTASTALPPIGDTIDW